MSLDDFYFFLFLIALHTSTDRKEQMRQNKVKL